MHRSWSNINIYTTRQTNLTGNRWQAAQAGEQAELTELEMKCNTAYCIVKEKMAFTKFGTMLLTQKKNGLQINPIIDTIPDTIREEG